MTLVDMAFVPYNNCSSKVFCKKAAAGVLHEQLAYLLQHALRELCPWQAGLIDRLLTIAPPSLTRFFFANSGSEAVDNAIKIARGHTGRQNIICFEVHAHVHHPRPCSFCTRNDPFYCTM